MSSVTQPQSPSNPTLPDGAPLKCGAVLTPEMTTQEALGHVMAGRVPMEAFLGWQADREKRLAAHARKSASTGGANKLSVKVGQAGGLVLSGGKIHVAPQSPVNLKAHQFLALVAHAPEIVKAIEENSKGPERTETRHTRERRDANGNVSKPKPYEVTLKGSLVVGDVPAFEKALATVKTILGME